jgi:hypothetical protein
LGDVICDYCMTAPCDCSRITHMIETLHHALGRLLRRRYGARQRALREASQHALAAARWDSR